jgi:hypothetical protein
MSICKDVTKAEEISLRDNICPDCSGVGFLEGPCGGGSVNIICANDKCKARFNFCGPFGHQRLSYGKSVISDILPNIADEDVPPMPKCKPPREEALSEPKEIKIKSAEQIIDRLIHDGDLREHDFDYPYFCCEGDDLGFYQQGCEFLVHKLEDSEKQLESLEKPKQEDFQDRLTANAEDFDGIVSDMLKKLAEIQTCKQGHQFVAKSHEYVCPSCQLDKIKGHLEKVKHHLS